MKGESAHWVVKGLRGGDPDMRKGLSACAKIKGWPYVMAWCHRISGLILVGFFWYYAIAARAYGTPTVEIIQWILAVPVIYHALNGGRLVLYESFGWRNDEAMIRWVLGLSILYLSELGLIMLMGNQMVSPFFLWLLGLTVAGVFAYGVSARLWNSRHSVYWKLQRITAGFLLAMVPMYVLSVHLVPEPSTMGNLMLAGIQRYFVKAAHFLLFAAALYHAGYGVWSVTRDYAPSRLLQRFLVILIMVLMGGAFSWVFIKMFPGI
jgi:succinate dehydrogenase hydrophobic anchor subunit